MLSRYPTWGRAPRAWPQHPGSASRGCCGLGLYASDTLVVQGRLFGTIRLVQDAGDDLSLELLRRYLLRGLDVHRVPLLPLQEFQKADLVGPAVVGVAVLQDLDQGEALVLDSTFDQPVNRIVIMEWPATCVLYRGLASNPGAVRAAGPRATPMGAIGPAAHAGESACYALRQWGKNRAKQFLLLTGHSISGSWKAPGWAGEKPDPSAGLAPACAGRRHRDVPRSCARGAPYQRPGEQVKGNSRRAGPVRRRLGAPAGRPRRSSSVGSRRGGTPTRAKR